MDAASAFDALKSGDIAAFVAAVEWDEGEWVEIPADLRHVDENPFLGRFGTVTVGLVKVDESGKYDIRLHNHPSGEEVAKACFADQMANIRNFLSMAETMASGLVTATYTGQYI